MTENPIKSAAPFLSIFGKPIIVLGEAPTEERAHPPSFYTINKQVAVLMRPAGAFLYERKVGSYQIVREAYLQTLFATLPPEILCSAFTYWTRQKERREYEEVVFEPGTQREGVYNLWRGWKYKPVQGDCSLFWAHVHDIICDGHEDRYQWLRKWLAHAVQKTSILPETAVVLTGTQGTGKGAFVQWFAELFAPHKVQVTSTENLLNRFNAHLGEAIVIFADEATWGGDKQKEGILKALITEKRLWIEQKYQPKVEVANCKRLIVASNEDWPVAIGKQDRRMVVLHLSEARQADRTYFDAFFAQRDAGGYEALMYDLLHEDLTGYRPQNRPKSDSSWLIKLRGLETYLQFWYSFLFNGEIDDGTAVMPYPNREGTPGPGTCCVSKAEFHRAYERFCKARTSSGHTVQAQIFFKKSHLFSDGTPHYHKVGGGQQRHFGPMSLDNAREVFEEEVGENSSIWEGAADEPYPF